MLKKNLSFLVPAAWAALLLAVTLAACTSPTDADEALETTTDDLAALVADELDLSPDGARQLGALFGRHGDRRQPGFSWFVAAALQQSLTEEQKTTLFARAAEATADGFPVGGGVCGSDLPVGPGAHDHPADGLGGFDDLLTGEQREAIRALRAAHREEVRSLMEQHRSGDLSEEAFRTQVQALRDDLKAAIEALLTDEQKAEIAQRRDEREAERAARRAEHEAAVQAAIAEALGLSDDQQAAVDALCRAQQAERDAIAEQLQSGALDREGAAAALAALHAAQLQALESILDATQFEIVQIHDALAVLHARRGGPGGGDRRHGPGGSRG